MDANKAITLASLKLTHDRVLQHMYALGTYPPTLRAWQAASVTCSTLAKRKSYAVHLEPVKFQHAKMDKLPDYFWSGSAHNAYEARDRAWRAWLTGRGAL